MAEIAELREQAIQRVMREMRMPRETAERFVDRGNGRILDIEPEPEPLTEDEQDKQ